MRPARRGPPAPPRGPLRHAGPWGRCSLREARSRAATGAAPPPRRAPPRGGEAGRACSSSPGFCFPPGLTGPGFGSRQRSPTRPRPGAGDRSRPELTAREQPPPRAGEKLRLSGPGQPEKSSRGEPCAGTPRAQWSFAHLAGPAEGEDNGVSGLLRSSLRGALPGRWVWMRVLRLHLPPWEK